MTYDIPVLKKVMDDAVNAPELQPSKGQTFCNIGAFRIAKDLGYNYFWDEAKVRPMLANECVDFMEKNPALFSKLFNPLTAWDMANNGYLVFAALKDVPHGHIVAVYPSQEMVTSGKWDCQVPLVANIGKENKVCGTNYAFKEIPNFYLCI